LFPERSWCAIRNPQIRDPVSPGLSRERYEAVREIAAEILAEHSAVSIDEAVHLLAGENGHATPKVDLRGVVSKGGDSCWSKRRTMDYGHLRLRRP
jgi:hypothetical protein